MIKKYRPLKNFTRRLPTATFGNYRPKSRHTKPSLAWLVAARKVSSGI